MLLRNSITKTKKFFHKTFESFMSLLSGGYDRLPKTPPFNPLSCSRGGGDTKIHQSFGELDNFYADFTNRWDSNQDKAKKKHNKKIMSTKEPIKEDNVHKGSFMKFAKQSPAKDRQEERREDGRKMRSPQEGDSCSQSVKERGCYLVVHKLKELEMMDVSNVDHVLDIEEVLHYYSRLTCPAYLDIFDKFFMEMCSEFMLPYTSSGNNNSRQTFQSLMS